MLLEWSGGAENRRQNKRVHWDDGKSPGIKTNWSPGIACRATQLLKCCALPTWWSWRGTCTRSHSEHGREMPLRLWYSVLRRGRVGRCQVCQTQHNLNHIQATASSSCKPTGLGQIKGPPTSGSFAFYKVPNGRTRASIIVQSGRPTGRTRCRGVEQPGSSSGS